MYKIYNVENDILSSENLKPIATEERRIEEEEKKAREEKERIAKQLAEGSIIMWTLYLWAVQEMNTRCCSVAITGSQSSAFQNKILLFHFVAANEDTILK